MKTHIDIYDDLFDLEQKLMDSPYEEDHEAANHLGRLLKVSHSALGISGDLRALVNMHSNLPEYATMALYAAADELEN